MKKLRELRISFNAPAVLAFVAACTAVQLLSVMTGGASNRLLFSVYRSSLLDPLTYVRCIGHVLGHADWEHLLGNMMYILILGPLLEEKYGTRSLLTMMMITAVATALIDIALFPHTMFLGASGIVFAMILLASITRAGDGTIPVTFVLVAVLYIGQQVFTGVLAHDDISQLTHIVGGVIGSVYGFASMKRKAKQKSFY